MQVNCPTCKKKIEWSEDSVFRPFCSKRCRLIDLGAWFNEEHRIADESEGSSVSTGSSDSGD